MFHIDLTSSAQKKEKKLLEEWCRQLAVQHWAFVYVLIDRFIADKDEKVKSIKSILKDAIAKPENYWIKTEILPTVHKCLFLSNQILTLVEEKSSEEGKKSCASAEFQIVKDALFHHVKDFDREHLDYFIPLYFEGQSQTDESKNIHKEFCKIVFRHCNTEHILNVFNLLYRILPAKEAQTVFDDGYKNSIISIGDSLNLFLKGLGRNDDDEAYIRLLKLLQSAPKYFGNSKEVEAILSNVSTSVCAGYIDRMQLYSYLLITNQSPCLVNNHQLMEGPSMSYDNVKLPLNVFNHQNEIQFGELLTTSAKDNLHFFTSILSFLENMVRSKKFEDANIIMQKSQLNYLRPLLVLNSWMKSETVSDSIVLLNNMWFSKDYGFDVDPDNRLHQCCNVLGLYSKIAAFCLKESNASRTSHHLSNPSFRENNLLRDFVSFSILKVLKNRLKIRSIHQDELSYILSQTNEKNGEMDPNQERDVMVFRAYCTITHVVDAIVSSCPIFSRKPTSSLHEAKLSTSSESETSAAIENQEMKKSLDAAKNMIDQLYPISFRVEVLENVFSLLFLTRENIHPDSIPSFERSGREDSEQGYSTVAQSGIDREDPISESAVTSVRRRHSYQKSGTELENSVFETHPTKSARVKSIFEGHRAFRSKSYAQRSDDSDSDHISSMTGNCCNYKPFLCSSSFVREFLPWLKKCLVTATAAIYNSKSGSLNDQTRSASQRLSQLDRYVSEAQWRYELVDLDQSTNDGSHQNSKLNRSTSSLWANNKFNISYCHQYHSFHNCDLSPVLPTNQRNRSSEFDYREKSRNTDPGVYSGSSSDRKRVRKWKKMKTSSSSSLPFVSKSVTSVVNRMLSSPNSLVNFCLINNQLGQAKQVIQMFELKDTSCAKEVEFAIKLKDTVSKVHEIITSDKDMSNNTKKVATPSEEGTIPLGLTAIAKAAAAGVASTTCTSVVDQLLNNVTAPSIYCQENSLSKSVPLIKECQESDVLVITDLGLSSTFDLDVCSHLMNLASEKIPLRSSKMASRLSEITGFVPFFRQMFDLLQQLLEMSSADIQTFNKCDGLPAFLSQAFYPLRASTLAQHVGLWLKIRQLLSDLTIVLDFDHDADRPDEKKSIDPRVNFKKLIYSCSVTGDMQFLPTKLSNDSPRNDFLLGLYDYLRQLTIVFQDSQETSSAADKRSYFKVMKEGPTITIGRLAVHNNVSPERLEPLADKLDLDLTTILANSVCPALICQRNHIYDFNGMKVTVLNKPTHKYDDVTNPEILVRNLLTDLTQLMQETSQTMSIQSTFTLDIAEFMIKLPQFENILVATRELAFVDLDLLKTNAEKIAFYANLLNLMWLHCIFHEVMFYNEKNINKIAMENDENEALTLESRMSLLSSSTVHRLSAQASLHYQVGQLGEISYLDIRYGLLRVHLGPSKHVPIIYRQFIEEKKKCKLWMDYAPPVETRIPFVLAQGYRNSPALSIILTDMLQEQLENAMSSYLNVHIVADADARTVYLSSYIVDHEEDFCSSDDLEAIHAGFLNFACASVDARLKNELQSLISLDSVHGFSENIDESGRKELPFSVVIYPEEYDFSLKFFWVPADEVVTFNSPFNIVNSTPPVFGDQPPIKVPDAVITFVEKNCPILSYLMSECSASTTLFTAENALGESATLQPLTRWFKIHRNVFGLLQGTPQLNTFVGTFGLDFKHFWSVIDELLANGNYVDVLAFLEIVPLKIRESDAFQYILDGILCLLVENYGKDVEMAPWSFALRISNFEVKYKYVLKYLEYWPVKDCIAALRVCLSNPISCDKTRSLLRNELHLMNMYNYIFIAANNPDTSVLHINPELDENDWTSIARVSTKGADDILDILLGNQEYDVARDWASEHCHDKDFTQVIDESQVCHLLEKDSCDYDLVIKALSRHGGEKGVVMCLNVIKNITKIKSMLFVIDYMLKHLRGSINKANIDQFTAHKIGLKMLSCIPGDKIELYDDLGLSPHLLFEQLLMNAEVELAQKCLSFVSEDVSAINQQPILMNHDHLNCLIEKYALKALDVRIVQTCDDVQSIGDNQSDVTSLKRSPSVQSLAAAADTSRSDIFVMPAVVPTKDKWVPDGSVNFCMGCKIERFSMVNRRHHCRRCGRVVCTTCSGRKSLVNGYGDIPVRVCDDCCEQMINPYSYFLGSSCGIAESSTSLERGSRQAPSQTSSSVPNITPKHKTFGTLIYYVDNDWQLTIDEDRNTKLREEFSYNQAPCISLCLSILQLHFSSNTCGKYMLSLSDNLSKMLVPIGYKQANPEVDYGLVISMMKSLLLSAKVKFSEIDNVSGVEQCDLELQCVALLNVLVRANCNHLIPSDKLTNSETILQLRDQLVEEERWPLALELSTKAGLDVARIWATWGKFCLTNEDFTSAREKFAHCLRPSEKNHGCLTNPLLNVIIKHLENLPFYGSNKYLSITKTLANLKKLQSGGHQLKNLTSLAPPILAECLYYLKTYGSHHHMVNFYVQNNLYADALSFISKRNCDTDVFVDSFIMPCLMQSKFDEMKSAIVQGSAKFSKISHHLANAFGIIDKRGFQNMIYELQVFVQDEIRAATTCIKFFQQAYVNYHEHYENLHFLYKANAHFNNFLENHEAWGTSKNITKFQIEEKYRVKLPPKDINRHINTIDLQITITKFLQHCEDKGLSTKSIALPQFYSTPRRETLPTLFGTTIMKAYLCATILVSGGSVSDGFGTAYRIMQDFKLNNIKVYSLVSRNLIKQNRVSEIFSLLECIQDSGYKDANTHDEVLFSAVEEANKTSPIEGSKMDELIKAMRDESKMINAYILSGKLTQAYLLAIKKENTADIQRILSAAEKCGQNKVKNICEKWLNSKKKNSSSYVYSLKPTIL